MILVCCGKKQKNSRKECMMGNAQLPQASEEEVRLQTKVFGWKPSLTSVSTFPQCETCCQDWKSFWEVKRSGQILRHLP